MPDLNIGLSGLRVAQDALDIIGANIANAATPGYHRQTPRIASQWASAGVAVGGAEIVEIRRSIDALLENGLQEQGTQLGQVSQELLALRSIESALGELGSEGLGEAITRFFGALKELAAQPTSQAFQEQAVWAADGLAKQFQTLGDFLADTDRHLRAEGDDLIRQANTLLEEIASLDEEIEPASFTGGQPNLLKDRRDQAIAELSELMGVDVRHQTDGSGTVTVTAFGTPLVLRKTAAELVVDTTDAGLLGVSVGSTNLYFTDVEGGRLGGVFAMVNTILPDIRTRLDTLAGEVAYRMNALHAQGVGPAGSFTSLLGQPVSTDRLDTWTEWGAHVQAGTLYVRVTDANTGTVARSSIAITAADTLATIAGKLDVVTGLTGTVTGSALNIGVEDSARYTFDFLLGPVTTLQGGWSGTASPTVSGTYIPQQDETLTCTVTTGGTVGLTGGTTVEVRNAANELVKTLSIGLGYAAGDPVEISDGLHVAFDTGTLTLGEQFTIESPASSDSSGFLATAGINTFFTGNSMQTIAVHDAIMADPTRLGSTISEDAGGNVNILRMAELNDTPLAALGNVAISESYRLAVTDVGHRIRFSEAREAGLQSVQQQLYRQRDEISGVDINEEAARMLVFEQMFQAMARFIATQEQTMGALMELL